MVSYSPKIYHITHIDNVLNISETTKLVSDAHRIKNGLNCLLVGMSTIKKRRINEIEVICHPGTKVGDYVPFYFCPRSVMLYILHRANHPELTYRSGQESMVHLEADFNTVVRWAMANRVRWAFSDGNAGAYITTFYDDPAHIEKLDWDAIVANDFRDPKVKEGKQAEFLVFDTLPWMLIEKIGTSNELVATRVRTILGRAQHRPVVSTESGWYF